jgi:predicted Zn-dependent peptidase
VIQDFATSKIAEKDLQMVKNQSEASLVFGEVEVLNRAMNLAMAANAGDANLVNTEAEKIAEVQTQDLEKWAQRLFIQGKSNTLKYKNIAK